MGELQGQEQGILGNVDDRRRCVFLGKFCLRIHGFTRLRGESVKDLELGFWMWKSFPKKE